MLSLLTKSRTAGPLTFPHLCYFITTTFKVSYFSLRTVVHVFHGSVFQAALSFAAVGVAGATAMSETALEFVHGLCFIVIAIYRVIGIGNSVFCLVACMLNTMEL